MLALEVGTFSLNYYSLSMRPSLLGSLALILGKHHLVHLATNKKNSRRASVDVSAWLGIVIMVLTLAYVLRTCAQWERRAQALEGSTVTIKAVVIDKKNYLGNSPVSHQFAYSYRFQVKGQLFEGNSHDPALRVGDSLVVDYALDAPEHNRPHKNV
jgi:hypothetical protein